MRRNTLIALVAAPAALSLLVSCTSADTDRPGKAAQVTATADTDRGVIDLTAMTPGTTAQIEVLTVKTPDRAKKLPPEQVPDHLEMLDDLFQRAFFDIEQLPTSGGVKDRYADVMTTDANADHNRQVADGNVGFGLWWSDDLNQTVYDWRVKDYTIEVTGDYVRDDIDGYTPGLRADVMWKFESIQPASNGWETSDTSDTSDDSTTPDDSAADSPQYERVEYWWTVGVGTVVDQTGKPVLSWWNWHEPREQLTDVDVR